MFPGCDSSFKICRRVHEITTKRKPTNFETVVTAETGSHRRRRSRCASEDGINCSFCFITTGCPALVAVFSSGNRLRICSFVLHGIDLNFNGTVKVIRDLDFQYWASVSTPSNPSFRVLALDVPSGQSSPSSNSCMVLVSSCRERKQSVGLVASSQRKRIRCFTSWLTPDGPTACASRHPTPVSRFRRPWPGSPPRSEPRRLI